MVKVLLIGLDAASHRWISLFHSYLPTFTRLMQNGMHGPLITVPPPTTSVGWPALFQGLNPGKSRSFCFSRDLKDYRMQFFSKANFLEGDTVWDILSREDYKSLVFNVPMTYPAKPLNGTLVCSFDSTGPGWAYPKDAMQICADAGFLPFEEKDISKFATYGDWFDYWVRRETLVKDLALHFIEAENPDFAFVTFLMLDRLGHKFAVKDPLSYRMSYMAIDRIIRDLIEKSDPEHIIIASDHGMIPLQSPSR